LLVVDLFGADQSRGVAGAGGGDSGIKWMREGIAQRYARYRALDAGSTEKAVFVMP